MLYKTPWAGTHRARTKAGKNTLEGGVRTHTKAARALLQSMYKRMFGKTNTANPKEFTREIPRKTKVKT
jgi:hypothetical protein